MSDLDSNMSWKDNMNIVFGQYGWRMIPYYNEGEKMVEIPREPIEEPVAEVVEHDAHGDTVEASIEVLKKDNQPTEVTNNNNIFGTNDPASFIEMSRQYSKQLVDIVEGQKLYAMIQGKKYMMYEGWQFLGSMLPNAITPQTEWTNPLTDENGITIGYKARVIAVDALGNIRGAGEALCMRSERNWSDKDEYALMSMAQTRAGGKALRMALSSIVKLAGYEPTPKEEMDGIIPENNFNSNKKAQPTTNTTAPASSGNFEGMATEKQISYLKVLVNKNLEHEICKDVSLLADINKGEITKSKASELIEALK